MPRALITGITGQDGAYLARFLIDKGYQVVGTYRQTTDGHWWRLKALDLWNHPALTLLPYDLADACAAIPLVERAEPDELYHLASLSQVAESFAKPTETALINGIGALRLLEAVRAVNPRIRFFQASSSEMFGPVSESVATEKTPFAPNNPYGVAKLFAHGMAEGARDAHGLFVAAGILFNHESPLRGLAFVTRKITHGVARIATGQLDMLCLGQLDARRDWGFAGDFVDGMWRLLQAETPETCVFATGRATTVRAFAARAFARAGIRLIFEGDGLAECARDAATGQVVLRVDARWYRPAARATTVGDCSKARTLLGWNAVVDWESLVDRMVDADLARVGEADCQAQRAVGGR